MEGFAKDWRRCLIFVMIDDRTVRTISNRSIKMPEYQAVIKSNIKGVNQRRVKILSSCFSDAEKEIHKDLTKGEYLHSLDNASFPKDRFNVVEYK